MLSLISLGREALVALVDRLSDRIIGLHAKVHVERRLRHAGLLRELQEELVADLVALRSPLVLGRASAPPRRCGAILVALLEDVRERFHGKHGAMQRHGWMQ